MIAAKGARSGRACDEGIELSIVMPCLNEAETIEACIADASALLSTQRIAGEIVVADNDSGDGSGDIARRMGARVVLVSERGYGKALMKGIAAARGRYVLIGDADGSYDFRDAIPFVEKLREGYDLVQGCRLKRGGGTVLPGAMPALHRRVGNPLFSWLARRWFRAPVSDVYCGLRAFTKAHYDRLDQRCEGMEFAAEMIVKSSIVGARIAEVPITLRGDGRTAHNGHLRTARDGWRTLRYLLCEWRCDGARSSVALRRFDQLRYSGQPAAAFDTYAAEYEQALQRGLRYSGEGSSYFARGRLHALAARLRELDEHPEVTLDFGCGTGHSTPLLNEILGSNRVIGVDVSAESLRVARARHCRNDVEFQLGTLPPAVAVDCAYANGVLHHIPAPERVHAIRYVFSSLRPDGVFALCENNPWNPGTRLVMRSIAFDRDAVPLAPAEARRLLRTAGFEILSTDFLFVFPRPMRALRRLEESLQRVPIGAQYIVLARKASA